MTYLEEAFRILNEQKDILPTVINIDVYVEVELEEKLPSGIESELYDEQTLEDWYDFAGTVEGIIDNFAEIVNISLSHHENSLSEYIDFYSYDTKGNKKNYLIDLRLSDHSSNSNIRNIRKHNVNKLDSNYVLKSIIVNDKVFSAYSEAIAYVRALLAEELVK